MEKRANILTLASKYFWYISVWSFYAAFIICKTFLIKLCALNIYQ